MIHPRTLLSRTVLTTLVAAPFGVMTLLSVFILLPTLKNPESKFYSSGIGYPAQQRLAGKPIKVKAVSVVSRTLGDGVVAPGESDALQQVAIRPQVSGQVEKVFVSEGEQVRKGQPLLQLQQAPFQNNVNTARNNVTVAEGTLEALQSSVSKTLAVLKADVEVAQVRLAAADKQRQEVNSIAQAELNNNIDSAKVRLATAETKLRQLEYLVEQGGIARFQLYDMQDIYATRKKELLMAQKGILDTQLDVYDNQDFYTMRQADLVSKQLVLNRTQNNLNQQIATARLNLQNKRIVLQDAQRDLNRTVIYATTDGLVSQVNIHSGEIADKGNRDAAIMLTQDVVFKAFIDQARLNTVKVGESATVRLVAYPGRTYKGQVIRINPTVATDKTVPGKAGNNRQYTYSVWVSVKGLLMPSGLQGYVQFDRGKTSLVIPESAVTHLSNGEGMVMVIESGRAVIKKVKLGPIFDNQREVIQGLQLGEQVVTSAKALHPGDRLEVIPAQG